MANHPEVSSLYYLGTIDSNHPAYEVYQRQYTCAGAMIAFEIKGTEKEAFTFLNKLKLIKLAVSLGSTESLIQHPATMTHAGVAPELKKATISVLFASLEVNQMTDRNKNNGNKGVAK